MTAVELNPKIAEIYKDFFPNDNVVVGDAHQYLLNHFKEFDFIWSSPPCPTHSKLRFMQYEKVYPDLKLYEEIILLKTFCKCKWVVENVIPYYNYLIKPETVLHRHSVWSNFHISQQEYPKMETCKKPQEREFLSKELGFDLSKYEGVDKRKILRNCVLPAMGLHVFNASKDIEMSLFDMEAK